MELTGLQALITIVIQLGFIWIAFYALQGLHMERWFRRPPKTLPLLICEVYYIFQLPSLLVYLYRQPAVQ